MEPQKQQIKFQAQRLIPCYLCGGESKTVSYVGFPLFSPTIHCPSCGLIRLSSLTSK